MKTFSVILLLLFISAPAAGKQEVPVEAFARLPALAQPVLSPSGDRVAVLLANEDGYYDVAVTPFGTSDFRIVAKMKSPRDRIASVLWANDERLLVSAMFPEDVGALTYYMGKLYSIDVESGDMLELRPKHFETSWGNRYSNNGDVISVLRDDPDYILVEWMTQKDEYPSVYKVNVRNGRYEKLFLNTYGIDSWYADYNGRVTLGIDYSEEENEEDIVSFWVPDADGDDWRKVKTVNTLSDSVFSPLMLGPDGKLLYVLSTHEYDTKTLYTYDVEKGEFVEELWHVDGHDIETLLTNDGLPVGVTWTEDFTRQHFFDEQGNSLHKLVQNTFRGAEVSLATTNHPRNRVVVRAVRDDMAARYYLLDLVAGKAVPWFSQYPELSGVKLSVQQPFEYQARDGMKLHGYLTMPSTAGAGKPPLVVLPHGGPWARDYRSFDFLAQLFANRGYAVLQPNFRGSSDFGASYERAGDRQWGQKMQTDVYDAIEWVKAQGTVDADRMCIVGASYGGYVALEAAVKTPDMFDCVVSIAGVSDLVAQIEDKSRLFGGEKFYAKTIGDVDDAEGLKALKMHSPIYFVDRLKAPVLLFHGTNDSRVAYTQSARFYERAEAAGADVEYIEVKDATHFLDDGETRLKALRAVDDFLEEHLR